ncbi:hypothetical protein HAT2_00283 [Candidatus Similichlamydia laticola]|uniref:Uncharacterized protein n=1 Tax=Candidatus Similichlamydia laticola TaxID=2170265 RepID=A0A369KDS5_9BACT|nr:hypothetical protein HAT2_00283 [Candidatus Similichlamydia laticola]
MTSKSKQIVCVDLPHCSWVGYLFTEKNESCFSNMIADAIKESCLLQRLSLFHCFMVKRISSATQFN